MHIPLTHLAFLAISGDPDPESRVNSLFESARKEIEALTRETAGLLVALLISVLPSYLKGSTEGVPRLAAVSLAGILLLFVTASYSYWFLRRSYLAATIVVSELRLLFERLGLVRPR